MEEHQLFTKIWKFAEKILLYIGLFAVIGLIFAGYQLYSKSFERHNVRNIINVQQDPSIEEKWQLGYMSEIKGSPYVMIPLNSKHDYGQSYYSKSSSSARDFLFINSQNNEKHWLLNTNQYLITNFELLTDDTIDEQKKIVRAVLYKVVKSDTNNDEKLTNKDTLTIALSLPDGKAYKEILKDVDVFVGYRLVSKDTLLIVYQRNRIGYSANVKLSGFAVFNKTELPKVGLHSSQ